MPLSRMRMVAFVPSSLLLGVTRYVTTDVAPVPLLWVIPLALYLLTFVLAFAERVRVPDEGLSVVATDDGRRLLLADAVRAAPASVLV